MTPIQQLRVERQENYELYLFRKDFLIYDDDDVRKAVFETLMKEQFTKEIKGRIVQHSKIIKSFKISGKIILILIYLILVQFNNQTCLDCGAKNDVRLMPGYCHGKMINKHPKNTSRYHPKGG